MSKARLATVAASVGGALLASPAMSAAQAAETAKLTIKSPANGSSTNSTTPTIRGTTVDVCQGEALELCDPITVRVYPGPNVPGPGTKPAAEVVERAPSETWSIPVSPPLPPGEYTAQAEQAGMPVPSNTVTFTIDTTPPQVSIASPANGSSTTGETQMLAGGAGTAPGDQPTVTVNLYTGSIAGPTPLLALSVQRSESGSWSAPFGGLVPGTYTAQATQRDNAGNVGRSAPVTFTINPTSSSGPPPAASFTWFPASPVVGQSVALVSSSTDSVSPISGYAWDVVGNGPFKPGGPVLTTSFATPGKHVVRLQVSDARGAASIATQTINVSPSQLALMQPFPIVRIAGKQSSSGVTVSLLTVQAPIGARVSLACRGRGCSRRFVSRTAIASKRNRGASSVLITFRHPERRLRPGAILEVRVSRAGQIGKFTRFAIHRRKLPSREDACIASTNPRPIVCPA